jgi:putative DNA primase/helicase
MTEAETIRAALSFIPPDLPRDEWARVAMALKSELGEDGFDLFDEWSARGETYKAKGTRDTWRSIKAGGAVGIGTLFYLAGLHGYKPSDPALAPKPTPAEVQAFAQARAERIAHDLAEREARQSKAAALAVQMYAQASDEGQSPYLVRKGVQGFGVRYDAAGWLLVPMHEAGAGPAGELLNLQRIAPEPPPDGGPEKLFLKGGRKTGLAHWCGDPTGAAVLLICEGFATAGSVHQATGRPVAVAFDAGNLAPVAKAIRKAYPAAFIVLASDNDTATEAKTGTNPGRMKSIEAAQAVRGVAVWPGAQDLPPGGSDFNDLAAHAGLDAVRELIEATISAGPHSARGKPAAPAPSPEPENAPTASPDGGAAVWGEFTTDESGVWFAERDRDGGLKRPQWVCSHLAVTATTSAADGGGYGYLLEFTDPRGKAQRWAMPARMLAGDGAEYRATLLNAGLRIAPGVKPRGQLTTYIQTRNPAEMAQCTDRIGWHGRAFVLPRETLQRVPVDGEEAPERIVFQTDGTAESVFRMRGTLAQWRERVATLCVSNSRLMFAVCSAFAGPMLRPSGMESGGFHLRGDSSGGKTTALRLAGSVWGGANYLQRWRATDNALEAVAAQHCDGLLILDELAQVDPKTAGECAYMLANQQSKARSNRNGQPRPRLTWRLLFLSAGEIGLAQHMSEGGKRARAGQELRMADVPADAGAGLGIFETLHGHEGGAVFANALNKAAEACHGTTGRAWLEWAVANVDTLRDRTRAGVEHLAGQWVPDAASGQVQRVGRRFALVAVAGELATDAGLTGWPQGEATRAVRQCFEAWLATRQGGIGNAEEAQMLTQVRRWLQLNGAGRFTWWHRALDDRAPDKGLRAGFRRMMTADGKPIQKNSDHLREFGEQIEQADAESSTVDHFVFAPIFDADACEGFDATAVKRLLRDRGHLVADKGRPFDCKPRLPGMGLTRCYRIRASIFEGDD